MEKIASFTVNHIDLFRIVFHGDDYRFVVGDGHAFDLGIGIFK